MPATSILSISQIVEIYQRYTDMVYLTHSAKSVMIRSASRWGVHRACCAAKGKKCVGAAVARLVDPTSRCPSPVNSPSNHVQFFKISRHRARRGMRSHCRGVRSGRCVWMRNQTAATPPLSPSRNDAPKSFQFTLADNEIVAQPWLKCWQRGKLEFRSRSSEIPQLCSHACP